MDAAAFRMYCLAKKGVTEHFPFDEVTLVFKVGGKMFALCALDTLVTQVNLKCDPERSIALREHYHAILPGYHMNKNHWNTLILDGSIPLTLVKELIDHSYNLILQSLPAAKRALLNQLPGL